MSHDPGCAKPVWSYPALVACIGENRACRDGEFRMVAERIWREGFRHDGESAEDNRSFSRRRAVVLATLAALEGASTQATRPIMRISGQSASRPD